MRKAILFRAVLVLFTASFAVSCSDDFEESVELHEDVNAVDPKHIQNGDT